MFDVCLFVCLICLPSVHRGGTCWFTFLRSVHCPVRLSSIFHCAVAGRPSKHETLTQCWINFDPPSTTLSQHQASIGLPCQMWASVTNGGPPLTPLTQLLLKASCRLRQHEVLTRAERILVSTGDACPTINRHWVGL